MPRMRNTATQVVVNVPDEKADRLGSEWEPVEKPKRSRKADAKSDE